MESVIRTDVASEQFLTLVRQLDDDLVSRYGPAQREWDPFNVLVDSMLVAVLELDGVPAACGALKPRDEGIAEVKRVFVTRSHRGKGLAKRIMAELEAWGRESGFIRLVLETGPKNSEAIGLYRTLGYDPVPYFPPYLDNPLSICLGKTL
jgi:putative acetyltransferase